MTTQRIAELEAEVMRLREALIACRAHIGDPANFDCYSSDKELAEFLQQVKRDEDVAIAKADEALSTPFTPTALHELIEKVSEAMRQRAISAGSAINPIYGAGAAIDAIRALPNLTLEELL